MTTYLLPVTLVLVAITSACSPRGSLSGPNPHPGTGTVPIVVEAGTGRGAPTDGGPWAAFCTGTRPACQPRLIEVCTDPYDPKSCHKELAAQVAVCVKKVDGDIDLGYAWECALKDWFQ